MYCRKKFIYDFPLMHTKLSLNTDLLQKKQTNKSLDTLFYFQNFFCSFYYYLYLYLYL